MKERTILPDKTSRTLDAPGKTSNQPSVYELLQTYSAPFYPFPEKHTSTSILSSDASSVSQFKPSGVIQKKGPPLLPQFIEEIEKINLLSQSDVFHEFYSKFQKAIIVYDLSTDGRPSAQNKMVQDLQQLLSDYYYGEKENQRPHTQEISDLLVHFRKILQEEFSITAQQKNRLTKFTKTDEAPYEQMTTEGLLWRMPEFEHNVDRVRKEGGKTYFQALSEMNMNFIQQEIETGGSSSEEWFPSFVEEAEKMLSTAVVNHYTTSTRAQAMLQDGMKSKMLLERDLPSFKHNTSIFDDYGLANSGFLFFFIESPSAPLRGTRFAVGDEGAEPARISIPIQESGLLTKGWLMLSDFAQREYPDLMTKKDTDEFISWLPTRKDEGSKKNPDFTIPVRHFQLGQGKIEVDDFNKYQDPQMRQALSVVALMAKGDKESKQHYSSADGITSLDVPERLMGNILVGSDIIPGLARRAALEVARIKSVNPSLGDKLSGLRGDALMLLILKDLFRPQAMIPNFFKVEDRHVQLTQEKERTDCRDKILEDILTITKRLAQLNPDIYVEVERWIVHIMGMSRFQLANQLICLENLREELLAKSRNREIIPSYIYMDTSHDLKSAICEIAEDGDMREFGPELVETYLNHIPFESLEAMIQSFAEVLEGRKELAKRIAEYLLDHCTHVP